MKKRMVGCLVVGSLCVAGIATLGCSDKALLWFVNATLPNAHLSLDDLNTARQNAFAECKDIIPPALHKQCMLNELSRRLNPADSNTSPTSVTSPDGVIHA
jgi:hypothetical protein